jgi:N-acetylglucosamine-6-phosphate deacetylase
MDGQIKVTEPLSSCFLMKNADFFLPNRVLACGSAFVTDDRYDEFSVELSVEMQQSAFRQVNCRGMNCSAGWIDCQVNGFEDTLFEDVASESDIGGLGDNLLRHGTTRWFGALVSTPPDKLDRLHKLVRTCVGKHGLLGVHLEGPWLNPDHRGCHPVDRLKRSSPEHIRFVESVARFSPIIVTFAPEIIDPEDLDKLCAIPNVTMMCGHSDFSWKRKPLGSKIRGVTHLLNAMPPFSSRRPGALGWLGSDRNKCASLIADGVHVCNEAIAIVKRALRPNQLFVVSDSMPVSLALSGKVPFLNGVLSIKDGALVSEAGTIAGSARLLQHGLRFLVQSVGIPFDEALRMATLYPAQALGLSSKIGSLTPGMPADYVLFDNQFNVHEAYRSSAPI